MKRIAMMTMQMHMCRMCMRCCAQNPMGFQR